MVVYEKKRNRKIVGISMYLFVSDDQIQKNIDPKGLKTKMSSVLNVSNDSGKHQGFSIKDTEMFVYSKEQVWFKRAHVGKFLGLLHIHRSTSRLADKDQKKPGLLEG